MDASRLERAARALLLEAFDREPGTGNIDAVMQAAGELRAALAALEAAAKEVA